MAWENCSTPSTTPAAKRMRALRARESNEQHQQRLQIELARKTALKRLETASEKQARLEKNASQHAIRNLLQTTEQRRARRQREAAAQAKRRQRETPEERQARLKRNAAIQAARRRMQTPEERKKRLKHEAARQAMHRKLKKRRCSVCEDKSCSECVNAIKQLCLKKDNNLNEVNINHPSAGSSPVRHTIHCDLHTSELIRLYCETCNKLTCKYCQLEKHKNHSYKLVEEAATNEKNALEFLQHSLKEAASNEKNALKFLQHSLKEKSKQLASLKEEVVKQCKSCETNHEAVMKEIYLNQYRLYDLVTSQSHALVDEANTFSQMQQKKLKIQQQSTAKMESVVNHWIRFIETATNDDNQFAMQRSKKMIKDCLQSLSKEGITQCPTELKATFFPSESVEKAITEGLGRISWSSKPEQDASIPSAQVVQMTSTHQLSHPISENQNNDKPSQNSSDSVMLGLTHTTLPIASSETGTNHKGVAEMTSPGKLSTSISTSISNPESATKETPQTDTQKEVVASNMNTRIPYGSSADDFEPPDLVDLDYLDRPTVAGSHKVTAVTSGTATPTVSTTNATAKNDEAVQHDLVMDLEKRKSESEATAVLTDETEVKIVTQPKIVEIKCDPNEDWCAVCNNGGNLLCCDTCPKVYHLHCHVPQLSAEPRSSWKCSLCRDPNTTVQASTGDKTKRILHGRQLALCEQILLQLFCHQKSVYFREPVDRTVNPDYYKHIRKPMDLGKIKRRLANADGESPYTSVKGMFRDVQRMIINCYVFNSIHSDYSKKASALQGYFFERVLLKFPDAKEYLAKLMAKQKAVLEVVLNLNMEADERDDPLDDPELTSGDYQDYLWRPGSDDEHQSQSSSDSPEGNPRNHKRRTSQMSISMKR